MALADRSSRRAGSNRRAIPLSVRTRMYRYLFKKSTIVIYYREATLRIVTTGSRDIPCRASPGVANRSCELQSTATGASAQTACEPCTRPMKESRRVSARCMAMVRCSKPAGWISGRVCRDQEVDWWLTSARGHIAANEFQQRCPPSESARPWRHSIEVASRRVCAGEP